MSNRFLGLTLLCAASLLSACGDDDDAPVDGGSSDTGIADANLPDAGPVDAGDADAGLSDAGTDAGPVDGGPSEVVLRFSPRVGTAPFSCTDTYMLGTPAAEAEPVDFRLYVHDVRLVDAAGGEAPVTLADNAFQNMGVALLDFEDASGGCNQGDAETNSEIRGTVPAGDYVGVAFRVGIPFAINHEDLTSLPSPLNRTSLFWSWRSGHLFVAGVSRTIVAAGGAAPDAGLPGPNEHYTHIGSTMCVGDPAMGTPVTSCARPNRAAIALGAFDATTDEIIVDFGALKASVNVADNIGCHSSTDVCSGPFAALGIDWSTGGETPDTQTVFRVE